MIDTETTGLNHAKDEVIEIGAVAFTYDNEGVIGDVVGVYSGLRQPSEPIPAAITRLTGITDEMVAGLEIDLTALNALVDPADLVIAHNAAFDRPFCESLSRTFAALLRSSQQSRVRIYAENAPFDMKDHLKARGYRWSDGSEGRPRAWWIEIDEELWDEELRYLRTDIYGWEDAEPLTSRLTAHDRYRG